MGFNTSATTLNIIAKLTPSGRKKLIKGDIITSFSLGDSDANYYATNPLNSGEVPCIGGDIGTAIIPTNSTANNTTLRSQLFVNATGTFLKAVELQSNNVSSSITPLGFNTYSANTLTQNLVFNGDKGTDSLVNLFYAFGLPITPAELVKFTATTFENGGYADTALSGLSANRLLVVGLDSSLLGEAIDAKSVKVNITNLSGTFNLYATFEDTGKALNVQDVTTSDDSTNAKTIGNNIAFLFSDQIKRPNNDLALSWATGYNSFKPFSLNGKKLFNMVSDVDDSIVNDKAVGMVFLDKGIIVITHPSIVQNFYPMSHSASTVVSLSTLSRSVAQNITCIADRGEFVTSNNSTIGLNDAPRISEIALFDSSGDMVALAKTDRHVVKGVNEFLAFSINIVL